MRVKVILGEEDIKDMIKEKYGVNSVSIKIVEDYEGYGPMEHKVNKATAEFFVNSDRLKEA